MNNTRSFIELAAILFLFIGACTYTVTVIESIESGTELVYNLNTDRDRQVKTVYTGILEETYTGANIVHTIRSMKESEVDVEVNGVLYAKTQDYEEFDPSVIDLKKTYHAIYQRDASGSLIKIVFRG
ncbi:hypothetical protein [Saccharibacillus sp. JS10]|uniref:hypothetical protein n=1 Tax=Saccharibacillus sp. JS10 TaxID=2950552 RepID=UPI00210CAFB1|nr:hypothetical protein [Saccharibacillus sp. JS10]MCQ4085596.1 hypothetical protein [Saccharibacillus sp. JS10]